MITMADWKVSRKQKKLIKEVLKSGRLTYGPKTAELEEKFAEAHDRKYAMFTSSGTAALQIALHALKDELGWKDGDEVIMPAVTFVATMNVITYNNLKPKLVDVGPDMNINPDLIKKAITKKTKAIMVVHLLGRPADMKRILQIAVKHKLPVIEDSCETMFVPRDGLVVGSSGTIACFSTYLAHLMVTGVGGFIVTDNKKLSDIMRSMMFHGRDNSYLSMDDNNKEDVFKKRFLFVRQGYSSRATELEAALGLGDMDTWGKMILKRQNNAIYLRSKLADLPIEFPWDNPFEHAFMFFPMIVQNRDKLMKYLEDEGVHTRTMLPLTNQPIVQKILGKNIEKKYPMADYANKYGLLIGCHQYMKKKDLDYIINKIRSFYGL